LTTTRGATGEGQHVIVRDFTRQYRVAARAEGIYIWDEDGRRYIDGSGGSSAVVSIGHGVREVVDAMSAQAQTLAFVPMHMFTHRPVIELAHEVAGFAPGSLNKVWFVSGGSEATENAVKLARQIQMERGFPQRSVVISRWQSFHGATLGALGFGGHTVRRRRYLPLFENSPHIPAAHHYRCEYCRGDTPCTLTCATALEREIRRQGAESIAAFIAEPVVGAALGGVPAPPGYFEEIRRICDEYEVLFIADEVMTGFGRTGREFGIDHWNVEPDLIATAKGLSGGYAPLGAVIARDEDIDLLEQRRSSFVAGHTYVGHPVTTAAGLAVLSYIRSHDLIENARIQGERLLAGGRELMSRHQLIGNTTGLGLMMGLEFVRDRATKAPFPANLKVGPRIGEAALERGLITYPLQGSVDGVEGDMMKITPPLCITSQEVDDLLAILDEAIGAVERDIEAA
jgi:adenosylmethionine-8-amino-7-oxononanoate aminotransferase